MTPPRDLCGAACDVDPNNTGEAQNSAAYLELGGNIPVAVISDDEPFLQGLRFDVLPEGPELDGLVGANALGRARLELDYLSSASRAVFSCETDAARAVLLGRGPLPAAPRPQHRPLLLRPAAARAPGHLRAPLDAGVPPTRPTRRPTVAPRTVHPRPFHSKQPRANRARLQPIRSPADLR